MSTSSKKNDTILSKLSAQPEGYAECYQGFEEMFDTTEEYSDYMNKKEALLKAAFQYGVKMADGRKTRRIGVKTDKSERAELDR